MENLQGQQQVVAQPIEQVIQAPGENFQALAIKLLIQEEKNKVEVKRMLVAKGMAEADAGVLVEKINDEIFSVRKSRAQKDMLYGALWCIGGTVATLADIGFIFWGAIVFGAIQFFKGPANNS